MHLLNYELIVPSNVLTMDKYYHIKFKQELPYINSKGEIVEPFMRFMNKDSFKIYLAKLTKENPEVKWVLKTGTSRYKTIYTATNGRVSREVVRPNIDDSE